MEYRIIGHTSLGEISERVKQLIGQGWRPQGGICTAVKPSDEDLYFFQAMVK